VASLLCTASISLTCVLFAYCIIKPRLHGGGDGGDPVSEIITVGAQILILKAQLAAQMDSITIAANTYRDLQYIYDIIVIGVGGDLLGAFISKMYISVPTESLYNFVELGRKLILLYREICSILPDMTETFGKLSALESRMEILDPNYVRYTKNGLDKMFDSELNVFSIFDNS
jgi:hypothetical protein